MSRKALYLVVVFSMAMLIFVSISRHVHAGMPTGIACSTCHTMHNSQNGAVQAIGSTSGGGRIAGTGASAMGGLGSECGSCHDALRPGGLLKMDCIGCHAQNPGGAVNIIASTGAPQVAHSAGVDLAAGNFKYVIDPTSGGANDAKGHNVHGFGTTISLDFPLLGTPPGDDGTSGLTFDYAAGAPLMCAGANGCHGDRSKLEPHKAIAGAHHAVDTVLQNGTAAEGSQGGTVGLSYRFLLGVKGLEDATWEANAGHNVYKGADYASRTPNTMSWFCSKCHGDFHAASPTGIGTGTSPWVRHPTDVLMPLGGEFASYTYTNQAPVARAAIPASSSDDVTGTNRIVMCLSCHRAHAAPNDDSMRWTYDASMVSPNGCYTCHRNK